MGAHIEFCRTRPDHWGLERPEQGERVGSAYFSAWTAQRQQAAYGTCWHDCLVYLVDGEPMVGPQDGDAGAESWYRPDWPLALERVRKLAGLVEAAPEGHRREYDKKRLPEFVQAIELCARPENAPHCYVRFSY